MKFVLKILVLVAILIALVLSIKPLSTLLAKPVIESFAAAALPNGATIEAIDLSGILGGNIRVEGIKLHNVEGFETENAVTLSSIDLDLDWGTLLSDEVVINRLQIGNVVLNSEFSNFKNNFALLLADLKKKEASKAPAKVVAKEGDDKSTMAVAQAKTVTIEKIFVASVQMHQQGCDETIAISSLHVPSVKAVASDKVVLAVLRPILQTGSSNVKSIQSCLLKGAGKVKDAMKKLKSLF